MSTKKQNSKPGKPKSGNFSKAVRTNASDFDRLKNLITEKSGQDQELNQNLLDNLKEIKQQNNELKVRIEDLVSDFKSKISIDEVKERQFDRMEEELERYKKNFIYNSVQKRLFQEIIELSDKVAETIKVANTEISKEDLKKHLESLRKQFDQLFINQGIEKIIPKSDLFDGQFQEATDTVDTNIKEENQKVIEVLKEGFRYDQKLLRPQKVVVKKYTNQ